MASCSPPPAATGSSASGKSAAIAYRVLRAHDKAVSGIAFSPDGSLLASAGEDATVQVWFVEPFAPLSSPEQLLRRAAERTSAQLDDHDQPSTGALRSEPVE